MSRPPLILASTSPYRATLLRRLGVPFQTADPGIDESPLSETEEPGTLAVRLAGAKAWAVAREHPDAVVLGADQCVDLDGMRLGKPGTFERAFDQLRQLAGRSAVFRTGICILGADGHPVGWEEVPFTVVFRSFSEEAIRCYLKSEFPFDCAGSLRWEGQGPALMERTEGSDPTALMGLPLIRTTRLLEHAGLPPLIPPSY